ncbi:ABC transporter ATP-binding protein [Halosegnis sp.]|uniref:ABC transporter ATP-binding protein n=1 Tax=Halosegnis sp. TaxID=2864959 RepID=UPI0035D4BDD0
MSGDTADDALATVRADTETVVPRLLREYGRDGVGEFAVGAVAGILRMGMELVPSFVLAVAIDALFFDTRAFGLPAVPDAWVPASEGAQFLLAATIIAVAYACNSLFGWLNSFAWNRFAQRFQHAVRVDTYDALQRREVSFFDDRQTGEVMSVLNNDVNQLEEFLTTNLSQLVTIVFRVGGMGAVMLLVNFRLALVAVIAVPVLAYASYWFVQVIHPKYQTVRSSVGRLNARLENNVGGIETVKAFATEPFETDRVRSASQSYFDAQWDAITTRVKFFPTLQAITASAYVAVFLIGGWWVVTGTPPHPFFAAGDATLTAGTLVLFLNYTRRFVHPMRRMGEIVNGYQYAEAAAERIVDLLDAAPGVRDAADARALSNVEGHVTFEDVSFAYREDGDVSEQVLEDVSFTAEPGDYVGLVGPTGAGKSTTMKLLLRFYDPDSGTVQIDGTDLRDITLRSLRESVGYVAQEPYMFHGTVRENIAYGRPDATHAAIVAAAKRAGAHEFVTGLGDGYDTMVGERGVKLSGGQRQRLALARAVLHDPDVLVLDEATSHVDNETEAVIQEQLAELTADRTTFAVAHRLSTVRDADTILVFDDGRIIEQGRHEELLEADGLYANLWRVQLGETDRLPEGFVDRPRDPPATD